jgi:ribosomal protein S6-L-glutamate ligase RimK-like protein
MPSFGASCLSPGDPVPGRKAICWIFPDRSSQQQRLVEHAHYWAEYASAAGEAGLELGVVSPEAIEATVAGDSNASVRVNGVPASPDSTIFVTELYAFPHQVVDALAQMTTFKVLELAGFYLPIPPDLSLVMNDKAATVLYFRSSPVPPLPCVRIVSGRDYDDHDLGSLLDGLELPLAVKPASWGAGVGFAVARDANDLRALLGLASGSDCALVLQPLLGGEVADYRVYFVRGEVHTVLVRRPQPGELLANLNRGAQAEFVELPDELEAAAEHARETLGLPYFCVDYLFDGERFWLSEVELDGGTPWVDRERTHRILHDRFVAYDEAHDLWLATRDPAREVVGAAL